MAIEDALTSDVVGAIVSAQRMMKGGIAASVDSAALRRLGESSMKSLAILSWNRRPQDWIVVGPEPSPSTKHFLFYLRDQTFECDAEIVEPLVVIART